MKISVLNNPQWLDMPLNRLSYIVVYYYEMGIVDVTARKLTPSSVPKSPVI